MQADAIPRWRAMRHVDYREWADEVLGDPRQVYARDVRKGADEPLTFMGPDDAERWYEDARAGQLVCPVPGCPSPALTTRGPRERRHHFVHRRAPGDAGHGRAYVRRVTLRVLREWIAAQSPSLTVDEDADVSGVAANLLVTSPRTGRRVALIYVDGRYGVEAWARDYGRLKAAEVPATWIFALRPMFFRLPRPRAGAGPDDPVVRDRERGDLVLDQAIYRAMRSGGHWPLLISLERRELANLITPTGRMANRLRLRPPESGDRVLHLAPCALAEARLTRDGIATLAVPEDMLAGPWRAEPPPAPKAAVSSPIPPTVHEPDLSYEPSERAPPPSTPRVSVGDTPELRWKRGRRSLHKQLVDSAAAEALATPLRTDVDCDLLAVHWHTMLAVWLQRHPALARDPSELRHRLVRAGAGPRLSTRAVEGFLEWWNNRARR